jgi:hypothetical protein
MPIYEAVFTYRWGIYDQALYPVSMRVNAADEKEASHKIEVALQRLVGEPLGHEEEPHEATVCAGCGRPGSSTSEIPPHGVALHWVVRGARVCVACYQDDKRGMRPLNRSRYPGEQESQ